MKKKSVDDVLDSTETFNVVELDDEAVSRVTGEAVEAVNGNCFVYCAGGWYPGNPTNGNCSCGPEQEI